jgi:signal transduction histidine kinase
MSAPVTLDELRTIDLFDDLTDAEIAEWQAVALPYEVGPGELISEEGTAYQGVQLLITGVARAMQVSGDKLVPGPRQRSPTWMGAISTLTGGKAAVRMLAETNCRVASVNADDFKRLAASQPVVTQRVMQIVAPVMSRMAAIEQSREHLASLGTMAAGLAHELNNPAAAAERAASQLIEALETVNDALRRFVSAGIERDQAADLIELQAEASRLAAQQTALSALDASDAEDELLDALEAMDVPEAWKLAEPLASAGLDASWLKRVSEGAGSPQATATVLRWIAATLTARGLADELQESTRRMTGLVGAVKSYAYMDRGEVMEIDLHEGLETTVIVLGHKLKVTDIKVIRDYDRTLPRMMARGPELNQVWTNLLDNAIDALAGTEHGTITITTSRDADCALVQFTDNGPGMAPDVAARVFETFFTTKDVGKGTGLGLATAYRIVVDGHDGSITVDSEPGRTTFNVWLPYPVAALSSTTDD